MIVSSGAWPHDPLIMYLCTEREALATGPWGYGGFKITDHVGLLCVL